MIIKGAILNEEVEAMSTFDSEKIDRLQKNLATLRKIAGWSAEDLADMIGVTRQTIVNLENNSNYQMTKIQYIAIRAVMEAEIESSSNSTLGQVINILIDTDDVSEEKKETVQKTVTEATNSLGRRAGSVAAGIAAIAALSPILGPISIPMASSMMFARELLKNKNNKGGK